MAPDEKAPENPEDSSPDPKTDNAAWQEMEVYGRKSGPGCVERDFKFQRYGDVFLRENQMFFSGV